MMMIIIIIAIITESKSFLAFAPLFDINLIWANIVHSNGALVINHNGLDQAIKPQNPKASQKNKSTLILLINKRAPERTT